DRAAACAPVRAQRARAGGQRVQDPRDPRRLGPWPGTDRARLGLQPARRPRPPPGHGRGPHRGPGTEVRGRPGQDQAGPRVALTPTKQEPAMFSAPLNLQAWIEEHRHLLKPPVGNKCIYNGDFIVMVVGGPNARTDFHWDEGPEWFYQLEGEMVLRVQERPEGGPGSLREIPIRAGETFLLP